MWKLLQLTINKLLRTYVAGWKIRFWEEMACPSTAGQKSIVDRVAANPSKQILAKRWCTTGGWMHTWHLSQLSQIGYVETNLSNVIMSSCHHLNMDCYHVIFSSFHLVIFCQLVNLLACNLVSFSACASWSLFFWNPSLRSKHPNIFVWNYSDSRKWEPWS